jgi:hypothetical protein
VLTQSASLCVQPLLAEYLVAADLPLKQRAGAVDKYLPWDAWRLFLNGPDSSTFNDRCNASFTQLFVAAESCTNGGETERNGHLGTVSGPAKKITRVTEDKRKNGTPT